MLNWRRDARQGDQCAVRGRLRGGVAAFARWWVSRFLLWRGMVIGMGRKLVIELPDGGRQFLEQVPADDELQLQEQLKLHPELLPLEDLGLESPAVVVGRESSLESGRVDLVLLGNGGELAIVEFKTGPQNPDFRECLAQLLDYGSDLWGMTVEDFDTRVAQRYFSGSHCPPGTVPPGASLEQVLAAVWGEEQADDAVGWRERLQAQLRDGSFHYVTVAQRFTPPVLRTLQDREDFAQKFRRFSEPPDEV